MHVEIAMLGTFSVAVARAPVAADAWSRRGAASLVKLLALAEGRTPAPRAGHRRAVADGPAGRRAAAAAQGGALRPPGPGARRRARHPDPGPAAGPGAAAARGRGARRRRRVPPAAPRRRSPTGSTSEAEDALAAYGGPLLPEDLYEPWAADWRDTVDVLHRDLLRLAGRWSELVREDPTDEAAHVALARELAARGDVRAAERQLERMEQALRRELGTVPSAEALRLRAELAARAGDHAAAPARSRRSGWSGARPVGDTVRGHLDRADDGPRQHAAAGRAGRRRQVGGAGPGHGAGRATRLADGAGCGVVDGGRLAVRPRAGGVRRPLPAAPGAARRAGRQLPARARPGALRRAGDVERRDRAPAAVRRGGGAAPAGRQRPRAAAGRRRRARGGRGVAAAAALPGPDRGHRAGADRARVPAARGAARGGGEPGRPRRRRGPRPPAARRRRHPPAGRAPPPRPRRGDGGRDLCGVRRPAVPDPGGRPRGPGRQQRPRRVRARGPGGRRAPSGRAARLGVHDRRAARGERGGRGRDVRRPRGRARRVGGGAGGDRVPLPARPGPGHGAGHLRRRTSCPARAATSPSGWPPWARRRPGSPTSSSRPATRCRRSRTPGRRSRRPARWAPTATGWPWSTR